MEISATKEWPFSTSVHTSYSCGLCIYTAGAAAAPSTKSLRLKVTLLAGNIDIQCKNGRPAGSSSGASAYWCHL